VADGIWFLLTVHVLKRGISCVGRDARSNSSDGRKRRGCEEGRDATPWPANPGTWHKRKGSQISQSTGHRRPVFGWMALFPHAPGLDSRTRKTNGQSIRCSTITSYCTNISYKYPQKELTNKSGNTQHSPMPSSYR
jgi:hypothetical protein